MIMQNLRKTLCTVLIACFGLLPLSSFVSCKKEGATKLKINEVTHSIFYAPLYLADALGYFQEENIGN
jgi:NitT/TauT family transport system substrate-binding protein